MEMRERERERGRLKLNCRLCSGFPNTHLGLTEGVCFPGSLAPLWYGTLGTPFPPKANHFHAISSILKTNSPIFMLFEAFQSHNPQLAASTLFASFESCMLPTYELRVLPGIHICKLYIAYRLHPCTEPISRLKHSYITLSRTCDPGRN